MSTHTYYATEADPTDRAAADGTAAARTASHTSPDRPTDAPMLFDAASTARLHNLFDRENQAIVETKRQP
ncbi:MAG: hypothetical protein ABEJ78_00600 [Haloferacaceae archaeon]